MSDDKGNFKTILHYLICTLASRIILNFWLEFYVSTPVKPKPSSGAPLPYPKTLELVGKACQVDKLYHIGLILNLQRKWRVENMALVLCLWLCLIVPTMPKEPRQIQSMLPTLCNKVKSVSRVCCQVQCYKMFPVRNLQTFVIS
jgi:hypothetical protein